MALSLDYEPLSALDHHPIGASTGYMVGQRNNWPALVEAAAEVSPYAVELAALSENELAPLLAFLADDPALPFRFVSVHAPDKHRTLSETALVSRLATLPDSVDVIVVHPDAIDEPGAYEPLGHRLAVENMDERKHIGTTAAELQPYFVALPHAGLCFDIAHAKSVDPSMNEAHRILDGFTTRLRHVHVSSLDEEGHHVPLSDEDSRLFAPVLARCRDVPWVFEAPPQH